MEPIRLHVWMAHQGIAARRKCEEYIRQGLVKVNGAVVKTMGQKINPETDRVELDPSLQSSLKKERQSFIYLMLHKPKGYVTSVSGPEKPKVMELLENFRIHGKSVRLFPVGRLDKNSSGLLLFTNDGRFAYEMTHPKFEKEKEYEVTLPSPIPDGILRKLSEGVMIYKKPARTIKAGSIQSAAQKKGYHKRTKPTRVHRIASNKFRIVLTEGMNRQIRRMCRKMGFTEIELIRIRIGNLWLEKLGLGKYRILSVNEVKNALGYSSSSSPGS